MDLRERVVAACDGRDGSREQIARRFGVSTSWIRRLLQRRRETGSIAALPQNAGRKRGLDDRQMKDLKTWVRRHPDATLKEIKEGMELGISIAAIDRALRVLSWTLKKSRSRRRNRGDGRSKRSVAAGGRR
jgi:transposase